MGKYIKNCSFCGREFSLLFCDFHGYAYKVRRKGRFIYQCSYKCYCEELERTYDERNKLCATER